MGGGEKGENNMASWRGLGGGKSEGKSRQFFGATRKYK